MKLYAIIPARSGSKGVPNKNIKLLNGIPLIKYSIDTALNSNEFDDCIVTTDSFEYANIAKSFGVNTLIRPEFLSNDKSSDVDYLLHCIFSTNLDYNGLIVLLRPTTPIRDLNVVKGAISKFKYEIVNAFDSMRSVHELNEPPQKMLKIVNNEVLPYMDITMEETNLPRQNWEKCYHPNGYIDIIKISSIIENKNTYGKRIMSFVTNKVTEIDSISDFEYLESTLRNK